MKKYMNAPVVLFDRFENEDIIVTSDPTSVNDKQGYANPGGFVETRESIWN